MYSCFIHTQCSVIIAGCVCIYLFHARDGFGNGKNKRFTENTTGKQKLIVETPWEDKYTRKDEEVQILREYLRIQSVHPNIDYGICT